MPSDHPTTLRDYLRSLPAGPVADLDSLLGFLHPAWPELDGSSATKMSADKLDRVETAAWTEPQLTFTIERHGGMKEGSTRAGLQTWVIDIEAGTVKASTIGYRQTISRQPALKVEPIVKEIFQHIIEGRNHPAIHQMGDGMIRVLPAQIDGMNDGPKQTRAGRRKRFRDQLGERLEGRGWHKVDHSRFSPPSS